MAGRHLPSNASEKTAGGPTDDSEECREAEENDDQLTLWGDLRHFASGPDSEIEPDPEVHRRRSIRGVVDHHHVVAGAADARYETPNRCRFGLIDHAMR